MKAILLLLVAATSALAAPRTANLHLLYGGDDRANQNWSTLDSAYGRLSLFLGSPSSVGVGATNLFSSFNIWTVQQRFTGTNGGIDFDGQGIASGQALGVLIEDDIGGTGVVTPGSSTTTAGFGPIYFGADSKTQASAALETHTNAQSNDSVLVLRRSRGTGHGSESQVLANDYLGTQMMQGWVSGGLNGACTAGSPNPAPFSCCTGIGAGTCNGSWNGAYGQAMGLECYADENWDTTHLGTRCSFYNTARNSSAVALNSACTAGQPNPAPYTCCTGVGTGNCRVIPVEVWGTSSGSATTNIAPQFMVKTQLVVGNTVFQAAGSVPAAYNEYSYEDNTTTQKFDYVTEGTQGTGDHARHLYTVPQRVSISNSTTATTAMTLPLVANGPIATGACTTPGCTFTITVTAQGTCTTKGTSTFCLNTGETIHATKTLSCRNVSGTVSCAGATHIMNNATDPTSYFADTLTGTAISAQPITTGTSTTNLQIKVANPDANSSVYTWVVTANIVSSGN